MQKIVIITGQTATGKTDLGIHLAQEFNGEVISADSRQVYRGMDIGTGKDTKNFKFQISLTSPSEAGRANFKKPKANFQIGYYEIDGVKMWLYDVVNPNYQFNVGEYQSLARQVISDIAARGKTPIVVGGTGLYIRSLVGSLETVDIKPNENLRRKLSIKSVFELQKTLEKINKEKLLSMNNSDRNNPRRLIRAIEISSSIKKIKAKSPQQEFDYLTILLTLSEKILEAKIKKRVENRLFSGIEEEVSSLLKQGYSFASPAFSATGYQLVKDYLDKKITRDDVLNGWLKSEIKYAKRQKTWFKKFFPPAINIFWFDSDNPQTYTEVRNLIDSYIHN